MFLEFAWNAWEKRKLGEVADIVGGGTPSTSRPEYWNGEIDWYAPAEIGTQRYVYKSRRQITELGLEKSSAVMLPANKTILFTSRAGIGNAAILTSPATTNQGFQSMIVNSNTDTYFLYSKIPDIKHKAIRVAAGSTFLEISGKSLSKIPIKLPIFEEQVKIGRLFLKIDNLIAATQDKKKNLKYLRESIVLRLLDQDFNLINDSVPWKESRLGELVTFRKGRGYSKNELTFSGTPIILYGRLYTNYQVVIDNITDTFVKEHSDSVKSSGGDVIIPSSGETATDIARASSITRPDIILGGDLIVLNFNTNLINSPFLALSLSSGKRKSYLSRHAQGKSVVHLQNESLASLSLKLPSPDTQARIAEIILQIDKIIVQYDEKVTLLQRLKKMLLQGLFI